MLMPNLPIFPEVSSKLMTYKKIWLMILNNITLDDIHQNVITVQRV